ncbi:MAG TPA: NAD-dependent dehydratase [bacterium]
MIEGARSSGASIIFGDNLYCYGPVDGKMTEDKPYAATGKKGRLRAEISNRLMEAHREGKVKAMIVRASDYYGPGVTNALIGERFFKALFKGGAIQWIGKPSMPHTFSFIDDVAKSAVFLSDQPGAYGQVWFTPNAETLTSNQMMELIFKEAEVRGKVQVAPDWLLKVMGWFDPAIREVEEIIYEFREPYIVDHSKFENLYGANPTPHEAAIKKTVEWYRQYLG